MDEFDDLSPKDKLVSMAKLEGMSTISLVELNSALIIDACGNPHEIWDGGISSWVNVCIPMPVKTALRYLRNPKDFDFPTNYQDSIEE